MGPGPEQRSGAAGPGLQAQIEPHKFLLGNMPDMKRKRRGTDGEVQGNARTSRGHESEPKGTK